LAAQPWHKPPMIIRNARDAADRLGPLLGSPKAPERVGIVHIGRSHALIGISTLAVGEMDQVALPIRAIMAEALGRGAQGMVIAHNHPSGDPHPSVADIEATRLIAHTARGVGIRLHDHLIFAPGGCGSLRALGLI
jgi:DNA repair protein RadC